MLPAIAALMSYLNHLEAQAVPTRQELQALVSHSAAGNIRAWSGAQFGDLRTVETSLGKALARWI